MTSQIARPSQSHRLLQIGISIFLCGAFLGLVVERFPLPRLALSAHLIAMLQGLFLVVAGLLWPRLVLHSRSALIAFALLVYQAIAAPTANVLGAIWIAGGTIVPMAAGAATGSPLQEAVIRVGLRSAGAALIVGLMMLLWGLRGPVARIGVESKTEAA